MWKKQFKALAVLERKNGRGKMSQDKKSSLKVTALAIICVILVAGVAVTLALYLPSQASASEKDQTIASLNQQIAALQSQLEQVPDTSIYTQQINSLQAQISNLNATLSSMTSDYQALTNIVNLEKTGNLYSGNFTQDVNATTTLFADTVGYAGYIAVQATSNTTTTYAQLTYTFSEHTFSYNQTLGKDGTALFAVLPGAVELKIGNVGEADANNVTVTVVYYY